MPKFTDRFLSGLTLKPGQKDRLIFDTDTPGLGVRLSASGSRSFVVQWTDRATGKKKRAPLGRWGAITIEQARTATRATLGAVERLISARWRAAIHAPNQRALAGSMSSSTRPATGVWPSVDVADRADRAMTLVALLDLWSERHLVNCRPQYALEAARAVRIAFADDLAQPASRLTRARILEVLDAMDANGRSTMARQTLAYGRAAYGWALKREKVKTNPFVGLPPVGRAVDRERTLTEAEAIEVWNAAGALPYPWGPFYRLALLTLQRRDEVAGARWSEISDDLALWRIPGARMKNGKPHDVTLAEPARDLLRTLPRHQIDGKPCDLVFTTNLRAPISGFSKAKIELDKALAAVRDDRPIEPFRVHDFRRSGASWLAGAGFDTIAIDKILAHQPTKLRGVAAVYQRHSYAEERRRALEAWANEIALQQAPSVAYLKLA